MLMKRYFRIVSFCLLCIWGSSCSTVYYLEHHPGFADDIFYRKVISAEKKLGSNDDKLYLEAAKLRTQYTYAFIVEKADRLIEDDYETGKRFYDKALASFEEAISYGKKAIQLRHPELQFITDWIIEDVTFTEKDVPYLYWLGAAYGGSIGSSRGKAKWVIQLPIVGYLLETSLKIDPSWNYGAIHTAMISYTMARTDLMGNNVENATKHYEQAMLFSNGQDAGAKVSFAENVHVALQNKDEFELLLKEVLSMDVENNKELALGNIIARERALWLLSRTDELFY
jgi:tetratricopeptide (TPR) repeat protein